MKIDWLGKLSFLFQTLAFCLAISAIQYAFQSERPYEVPLVYSVCIGTATWFLIDFGRHLLPSSGERGWPEGIPAVALPVAGIIGGYLLGTLAADTWFGWSSWDAGNSQLMGSIMVTALAGVAGTYFFYTRGKQNYLETRVSEARRHVSEARLKLLETQLEPHMLFNTLANLRVLIASDTPRAEAMLDHLIAYLRATLGASRSSCHSLQAEFDRLRDYLELMAVRMGPRLAYELELPSALAQQAVPTLLLQPLVENAIKHGLEPMVQGGRIHVRAQRQDGNITLDVQDTGAGLAGGAPTGNGFGLAQVRERLAAAFDGQGQLEIGPNEPTGTVVHIRYPAPA